MIDPSAACPSLGLRCLLSFVFEFVFLGREERLVAFLRLIFLDDDASAQFDLGLCYLRGQGLYERAEAEGYHRYFSVDEIAAEFGEKDGLRVMEVGRWLARQGRDFVTPFIAFQAIIPSFCIVPYVTLLTRKAAAAVILSAFLVGCMKMVAGIVVNLRDGWYYGNHELPWTNPNLMLWAFWVATAILSLLLLFLGLNKYRAELGHVPVQQS
jgi:hypothetical protein